jgi:hypothetical protein
MRHKRSRPNWWILYLILTLMLGLFLIEVRVPLSSRGHQLTEIVIVLFIFRIIWIWLDVNEQALNQEELEERRKGHPGKLYIILTPDFLPLKEQIGQRVQQDSPAGISLAHFNHCLPDTKNDSLKRT